MEPARLISISEAARRLGVSRQTISDLVRVHGYPTHRMPATGAAKGLDRPTVRKLARLLKVEIATVSAR
jgi:excisionase family DNA binding protein